MPNVPSPYWKRACTVQRKPVDTTVEKVQAVVSRHKSRGIYQVGFQRRYVPSFQSCMKYIHEGQAGKVQFLQGMWQWMEVSEDAILTGGIGRMVSGTGVSSCGCDDG